MSSARTRPLRLFLDANVLISAAWKTGSKVTRLWQIPGVELITSNYVLAECRRNLPRIEQQERLEQLLRTVRILTFQGTPVLENPPELPDKDQPVLVAAVLARADFLITGDRNHFGAWYGTAICGIRVEPPASFPAVLGES